MSNKFSPKKIIKSSYREMDWSEEAWMSLKQYARHLVRHARGSELTMAAERWLGNKVQDD